MAKSAEPKTAATDTLEPANPGCPCENAAVARCIRAWRRARRKESANGGSDYKSECVGNIAYLRAVPPLRGFQNIRDFITCVAFAAATEMIRYKDAAHLLAGANIALAALLRTRQPSGRSRRKKGEIITME
jgi:hypothetical protein